MVKASPLQRGKTKARCQNKTTPNSLGWIQWTVTRKLESAWGIRQQCQEPWGTDWDGCLIVVVIIISW